MTRLDKVRTLEMIVDTLCTVEMNAVIDGICRDEYLAITDASQETIKKLLDNDYNISLYDGKLIVDKM